MWRIPSEAAFEAVARDASVTADGKPDRSVNVNTRLGYGLQRLYQPVTDDQPGPLGCLMKLLDERLSS
jgi:hypothetical protein